MFKAIGKNIGINISEEFSPYVQLRDDVAFHTPFEEIETPNSVQFWDYRISAPRTSRAPVMLQIPTQRTNDRKIGDMEAQMEQCDSPRRVLPESVVKFSKLFDSIVLVGGFTSSIVILTLSSIWHESVQNLAILNRISACFSSLLSVVPLKSRILDFIKKVKLGDENATRVISPGGSECTISATQAGDVRMVSPDGTATVISKKWVLQLPIGQSPISPLSPKRADGTSRNFSDSDISNGRRVKRRLSKKFLMFSKIVDIGLTTIGVVAPITLNVLTSFWEGNTGKLRVLTYVGIALNAMSSIVPLKSKLIDAWKKKTR